MCGIVGYIGPREAVPLIISGLEKLEYRGYDSAGVCAFDRNTATKGNDGLSVARAIGKLSELKKLLAHQPVAGQVGLGHTRWATHGKPTETNAHPHTAGRVSLIHNGIIENYAELRTELSSKGAVFKSETDTEVGAHLLNALLSEGSTPRDALRALCARVRGSYAFLAIDTQNPDRILVAKNSTPIVIGVGKGENFVASDIPALLEYTRDIIILEDGDIALISADKIEIEHAGRPVERPAQRITWDAVTAQKGGYKHFMLKEIHEQGRVVTDTLRSRIQDGEHGVSELGLSPEELRHIRRISIVACGTAWHAGLVTKFFVEQFARVPVEVDYASEFRYRSPVIEDGTLVLAISQSGETADTLGAIELAAKLAAAQTKGNAQPGLDRVHVAAICNVVGSSLSRKVQRTIYTHAGPEISVASTKAFITQITAGLLLAIALGRAKGTLEISRCQELLSELARLPAALDHAVQAVEQQIEQVAKRFCKARDFLFIGRGSCYPIALEGALKLKEISYIHAEGYPAGELKHGPIALIDEHMPVVVIVQRSDLTEKVVSNLREVESRGGKIIAVTDDANNTALRDHSTEVITVPFVSPLLSPMLLTVPLQLLAYYVAVQNGTDVDLPRNLAKSVTVE